MQKRAAGGHTWAMLLFGFAGLEAFAYRRCSLPQNQISIHAALIA
jgi:hypothetical protein